MQSPERFVDKFVTDLQKRCLENATERKRLITQAQRIGVGHRHPPHVSEMPEETYDLADDNVVARWGRLMRIVLTEFYDSDFRRAFTEAVGDPVWKARQSGQQWNVPYDGVGILDQLETLGRSLGHFGDEPATPVTGPQLARRLVQAMGRAA